MKASLAIAACALVLGACGATQGTTKGPKPPEESAWAPLKSLLPPPPTGFDKAVDVALRDRESIYEQINGGSVSFLEHGLVDALFGTYPKTGGEAAMAIDLEIYRFDGTTGAKVQFESIHGKAGKAWRGGAFAVQHAYGIELYKGRYLIRVTFNDGPAKLMAVAARVIASQIVGHLK